MKGNTTEQRNVGLCLLIFASQRYTPRLIFSAMYDVVRIDHGMTMSPSHHSARFQVTVPLSCCHRDNAVGKYHKQQLLLPGYINCTPYHTKSVGDVPKCTVLEPHMWEHSSGKISKLRRLHFVLCKKLVLLQKKNCNATCLMPTVTN